MKPHVRIIIALIIGTTFIGSAVFLRFIKDSPTESTDSISVVPNTEIRPFIPPTDSDTDAIPDWMGPLLGERIVIPETSSEPHAPTTTTGLIAMDIFSSVIETQNAGRNLNAEEFINNQVQNTRELMIDEPFTNADIKLNSDNSTLAQKKYGNNIAGLILNIEANGVDEEELVLLTRALQTESQKPVDDLQIIANAYDRLLTSVLNEPVPSNLTDEHLALVNVIAALRNNTQSFANVFTDPIPAMVRLERHSLDTKALYTAIINLYQKLYDAGIQWSDGDVALDLIEVQP